MTTDPEQLRAEIDRTRANLSHDVDALTEHVAPQNVARRQADKVKGVAGTVKDRVMGKADDVVDAVTDKADDVKGAVTHRAGEVRSGTSGAAHSASGGIGDVTGRVGDAAGRAGDRVGDAAGRVGDAASQAPARLRSASRGNPLAAGLIALGAGWLLGSLIPASSREQQLAATVKDSAGALAGPAKEIAQDVAGSLKQSAAGVVAAPAKGVAQEVVGGLKEAAKEAVQSARSTAQDATSKDEGSSTARHVQGEAPDASGTVRQGR